MSMRRRLISLVVLLFLLVFSWVVFNTSNKTVVTYPNFGTNIPQDFPLLGMDISHHQGAINWPLAGGMTVDGDSLQFVYIKLSEGKEWQDDMADENAKGAEQEGLRFGYYHFFLPGAAVDHQVRNFCEHMGEGADLLPVVDVETNGGLKKGRLVDSVSAFITGVEMRTGKRPMIYTYSDFYEEQFSGTKLDKEIFWIASYSRQCELMKKDNFLVWQFSQSGTISGIGESVDLNIAKEGFYTACGLKRE